MALKTVTEELDSLLTEEELEPFDTSELPLPRDYYIEVMAREAFGHAKQIQLCRMNIAANKAVGNAAKVKELVDAELVSRLVLSKIKKEYPESLKRVAALAQLEAARAKQEGS